MKEMTFVLQSEIPSTFSRWLLPVSPRVEEALVSSKPLELHNEKKKIWNSLTIVAVAVVVWIFQYFFLKDYLRKTTSRYMKESPLCRRLDISMQSRQI